PNTNVVIGRQQGLANIVISNVHISKKHCEMFYDDLSGSFCLVDHSTNGTYVNGERIKKEEIYSFKPEFLLGLGNECVMKVGVKNA
ncbi:MAG: FHA domain-containing protein, partial [Wujia sp.]